MSRVSSNSTATLQSSKKRKTTPSITPASTEPESNKRVKTEKASSTEPKTRQPKAIK